MESLKITLVQSDIIWEDVDSNLKAIEKSIEMVSDTDLVVLPEMFATGFTMNTVSWDEDNNEKVLNWMITISKTHHCGIIASSVFIMGNKHYNRFLIVEENGAVRYYDKRHLYTPGKEDKSYEKGEFKGIFEYNGWKILPQVCYDLRFPVWSRNVEDYDVMINVANWPAARNDHWETLLKARAIENQCYVVGVNRTGEDGNGIQYIGNSCVYSYDGTTILMIKENSTEQVMSVELNKSKMLSYRDKLNFLKDRDRFEIL